jgi:ferric-dicitrate binding protein FerR (iron transport regulator)
VGGSVKKKIFKNFLISIYFGMVILFLTPLMGVSQTADTAAKTDPMEYVIEDIHGSKVQVLEEGETQWETAVEGQAVDSGDEIKVGEGSEATLVLENETSVHLSEKSDMKIENIAVNQTGGFLSRLQVLAGLLLADVKKNLQDSHSTFEVESNGVVCGVRGTAFEVNAQGDSSQVSTHEGKVEVSSGNESHVVTAGNASSFQRGKFLSLRRLERSEIERFQKWRTFRQVVRQKRLQRIAEIQNHKRQPWIRKHPHLGKAMRHDLDKKKIEKKKNRKILRREDR